MSYIDCVLCTYSTVLYCVETQRPTALKICSELFYITIGAQNVIKEFYTVKFRFLNLIIVLNIKIVNKIENVLFFVGNSNESKLTMIENNKLATLCK